MKLRMQKHDWPSEHDGEDENVFLKKTLPMDFIQPLLEH